MGPDSRVDILMLGTFSAWRLGTLQSRALPFARELRRRNIRAAIVTVPWDQPPEVGVRDSVSGVPVVNSQHARPFAPLSAVRELNNWLHRFQPRVIHTFKPKGFGGLASTVAARHIPVVIDTDDWEGDGGWNRHAPYNVVQRRLFNWQEHTLLASASAITAASTLLARRARELRGTRVDPAVWRVPNGLEDTWIRRFSCSPAGAASSETPVVTLYSRFAEFEPDWLPSFCGALNERLSAPATLRLIGPSPDLAMSAGRLLRLDVRGYVAREELPGLLGATTLAIYPYADSLIARAKQSVKLLELMAAGCPVIASDTGDVARTLGCAGIASSSSDPRAFAELTRELLDSRDRLSAMRAAGPRRISEAFRIDVLTNDVVEAYHFCCPSVGT